jgi:gamma-glutamyltranspeptidase
MPLEPSDGQRAPEAPHAGRPLTRAVNGMVTSPHALASSAGADVLRAGGSAVDAAIAAHAVLAVVYPHMTSVGGDAFWLVYDAQNRSVRGLSAAGRAASAASLDWFRARGMTQIPLKGILPATLTVPGAVDGWCEAHAAYGRRPFAQDLAAAVECARDGFTVTERVAPSIARSAEILAKNPPAAAIFLPGGSVPRPGQRLRNPDLARTLEAVAERGRAGFYAGPVAAEACRYAREHGGFFAARDFVEQRSRWDAPLRGTYRDPPAGVYARRRVAPSSPMPRSRRTCSAWSCAPSAAGRSLSTWKRRSGSRWARRRTRRGWWTAPARRRRTFRLGWVT